MAWARRVYSRSLNFASRRSKQVHNTGRVRLNRSGRQCLPNSWGPKGLRTLNSLVDHLEALGTSHPALLSLTLFTMFLFYYWPPSVHASRRNAAQITISDQLQLSALSPATHHYAQHSLRRQPLTALPHRAALVTDPPRAARTTTTLPYTVVVHASAFGHLPAGSPCAAVPRRV